MDKRRQKLFDKYNGRCAFCGCNLVKGWHVWDIEPAGIVVGEDGSMNMINKPDDENLMPACKPCGSLRIKSTSHKMTIEEFRDEVLESFKFLRMGGITATSYGRAVRFGFIIETGKHLEFYFETLQKQNEQH